MVFHISNATLSFFMLYLCANEVGRVDAAVVATKTVYGLVPSGTILSATALGVGTNGGTTYVEVGVFTTVEGSVVGSRVVDSLASETYTATFVEAESWLSMNHPFPTNAPDVDNNAQNCTIDRALNEAYCVETIGIFVSNGTAFETATLGLPLTPIYTSASTQYITSLRGLLFNNDEHTEVTQELKKTWLSTIAGLHRTTNKVTMSSDFRDANVGSGGVERVQAEDAEEISDRTTIQG
ncbi:hypothetical protein GALMADRAFT_217246 [Galerina marginata CBS 339.88]|uniref:Uncharacterized protein n=1 Tax=Galerina marginata (strain CBS 339.88) TaxID=685588 RepID=A0A067SH14_GALM3|nr:hypothetical protein GALMADRAFT_217246 [Galerina marginata CBS 339.88]